MRWYYIYTIYKKTYKTVTSTTTRTASCSTGKPSGSVCVSSSNSTTTKTAKCSTGKPSGSVCVSSSNSTITKTASCSIGKPSGSVCASSSTSTTTRNATCPSGQIIDNGKCYKVIDNGYSQNVTYYRYRTRKYLSGTTDYKWSSTNNDKNLLDAGYKLTGTTRNGKGEK